MDFNNLIGKSLEDLICDDETIEYFTDDMNMIICPFGDHRNSFDQLDKEYLAAFPSIKKILFINMSQDNIVESIKLVELGVN